MREIDKIKRTQTLLLTLVIILYVIVTLMVIAGCESIYNHPAGGMPLSLPAWFLAGKNIKEANAMVKADSKSLESDSKRKNPIYYIGKESDYDKAKK